MNGEITARSGDCERQGPPTTPGSLGGGRCSGGAYNGDLTFVRRWCRQGRRTFNPDVYVSGMDTLEAWSRHFCHENCGRGRRSRTGSSPKNWESETSSPPCGSGVTRRGEE